MKKINLDIQKFAISPTSMNGTDSSQWRWNVSFANTTGTISENKSDFYINGSLTRLTTSPSTSLGTININYAISGSGFTTVSGTYTYVLPATSAKTTINLGKIIEAKNIPHNDNGEKTIHVRLEMLKTEQTGLTPALANNIILEGDIVLEKIYRYSTLLSVENFSEDDSYTALNYVKYSGSGASDTLTVKATIAPNELVLDNSVWGSDQISLNATGPLQSQSILSYLGSYLGGNSNLQVIFTLTSTIGESSLTTSSIAYMSQAYVFSKYKTTSDENFLYQKTYYTYNSTSNKYEELSGYAVFSTATTTGSFLEGKRYFEKYEDDTGTWYTLLKEGTDYQVGETITTHYPSGVYLENQSIATYRSQHGNVVIYERDDNYNICQHIVHNKAENRYRMAINGVVDPTGPPLQVYTAYDAGEATNKEDLFFYRPGDRVSITGYTTGALISNSQATLRWTVVLPKRLDFVKAPKIVDSSKTSTTCSMYVRCSMPTHGYVHGSSEVGGLRGNGNGTSWTTANIVKYPSSGPCNKIKIEFIRNAKWYMYANNTAGGGSIVTNNQPLVAEVSNLLLEFPTE